jgi:hypothetical protein
MSGTRLAGTALACAAAAAAFWQSARATVLWDLSYVLEISHRIRLGEAPYESYVVPQPPFTFLMQAAIAGLLPKGYLWPRVYCAVAAAATVVLTWRIIARQLALTEHHHPEYLALAAAAPVVFLNGYTILPLPFYDSDCGVLVLLAIWAVLAGRGASGRWRHVVAGALLVLPVFAKQNTGVAAIVLVHAALIASALGSGRSEWRAYSFVLAGSILAALGILTALHAWVGLDNLYHWTVEYAARRRLPGGRLLLVPYLQTGTWIFVGCALIAFFLASMERRWALPLGLAVIGVPALVAARTMIRWGLAARSSYLWGLGTIAGGALAIAESVRRRWRFESSLPLVAIGVAHAAFASQGMYDSSYGVWPLLMIALAPLAARLIEIVPSQRPLATAAVAIASVAVMGLGYLHIARQERLGFVDLSGSVEAATLPAIRGLAVPGTHVRDFERLISRTDALIPHDDGILAFPGEDPFFVASGRRPRLPVVLFDDTAMPFDRTALVQLLRERDIKWVVLKDSLQLRHNPWKEMEAFLSTDLPARYEEIEAMPRYRIFKLKAATSSGAAR